MTDRFDVKQQTTLRDFLNVIFRRKWLLVGIVSLATVLVVYLNERQPQIYNSSAKILVKRGEQGNVFSGSIRYLTWVEEVSSQVEVILSETVANRASRIFADSIAAAGLPPEWKFQLSSVRADVIGESNAFMVRYVDINPAVVQYGCEALTIAFQEHYLEKKAPPELEDFFSEQIGDIRAELADLRDKRNHFLNEHKFFGLEESSRFVLTRMGTCESELTTLNGDISSQERRLVSFADLASRTGSELERELTLSDRGQLMSSQIIQRIKFSLQALRMNREELIHKYTEKHPEITAIDDQIRELHLDLERQMQNAYRLERETMEQMLARRASLLVDLNALKAQLQKLPDWEFQLTEYDNMINKLERQHELLLRRQSESEIALASQSDWDVTILSHASPARGGRTRDYVRLALGPFLSLIVGLGIAFFLESIDHSVKNSAEAEEVLELPVLATISDFGREKEGTTG